MVKMLRSFVPRVVMDRLDNKQDRFLAELRKTTILFIKMPKQDASTAEGLKSFQEFVCTVMESCFMHGGTVRQLITDDKGCSAFCVCVCVCWNGGGHPLAMQIG